MPSPDTCASCHDEMDAKKPAERQVASLFDDESFRAAHASELGPEPIFSHKLHVKAGLACEACHAKIASNEGVDSGVAVKMAKCSACHAERGVANECSTCHRAVREDWKPASHAHAWMRAHGRTVRAHGDATANQCSLCHTESTCEACHKERPPHSHDTFFRVRGHGLLAATDRASCATCHTADSCDTCHRSTLPISHTGSFGGVRETHCLACHFPLKAETCFTCHKSTPGHLTAAPKPPWHTPAMNCRQCHGFTAPLPHVDKGDDCNGCHK
jgi:hypothetical protein